MEGQTMVEFSGDGQLLTPCSPLAMPLVHIAIIYMCVCVCACMWVWVCVHVGVCASACGCECVGTPQPLPYLKWQHMVQ